MKTELLAVVTSRKFRFIGRSKRIIMEKTKQRSFPRRRKTNKSEKDPIKSVVNSVDNEFKKKKKKIALVLGLVFHVLLEFVCVCVCVCVEALRFCFGRDF